MTFAARSCTPASAFSCISRRAGVTALPPAQHACALAAAGVADAARATIAPIAPLGNVEGKGRIVVHGAGEGRLDLPVPPAMKRFSSCETRYSMPLAFGRHRRYRGAIWFIAEIHVDTPTFRPSTGEPSAARVTVISATKMPCGGAGATSAGRPRARRRCSRTVTNGTAGNPPSDEYCACVLGPEHAGVARSATAAAIALCLFARDHGTVISECRVPAWGDDCRQLRQRQFSLKWKRTSHLPESGNVTGTHLVNAGRELDGRVRIRGGRRAVQDDLGERDRRP